MQIQNNVKSVLIISIILLQILLVLLTINVHQIWTDEASTLLLVNQDFSFLHELVAQNVGHSPVYLYFLKAINFFFDTSLGLVRAVSALSIIFSALLGGYFLLKKQGPATAFSFAMLMMSCPGFFYFSHEARVYGILILFISHCALSLVFFDVGSMRQKVLVTISLSICFYLHPYSMAYLSCLCVFLILSSIRERDFYKAQINLIMIVTSILIYLPWFFYATFKQLQRSPVEEYFPIFSITQILRALVSPFNFFQIYTNPIFSTLPIIVAVIFYLSVMVLIYQSRKVRLISSKLFFSYFFSFFCLILVSWLYKPILHEKYLIPAFVFIVIYLSCLFGELYKKQQKVKYILLLSIITIGFNAVNIQSLNFKLKGDIEGLIKTNQIDLSECVIVHDSQITALPFAYLFPDSKQYYLNYEGVSLFSRGDNHFISQCVYDNFSLLSDFNINRYEHSIGPCFKQIQFEDPRIYGRNFSFISSVSEIPKSKKVCFISDQTLQYRGLGSRFYNRFAKNIKRVELYNPQWSNISYLYVLFEE